MHRKLGGSLGKTFTKDLGISSSDSEPKGCWELMVGSQVHQHAIYSSMHKHIHVPNQLFMLNLACIHSQTYRSLARYRQISHQSQKSLELGNSFLRNTFLKS